MKQYISETIGTFAMIFCGTGAMTINEVTGGDVTHVGSDKVGVCKVCLSFLASVYIQREQNGRELQKRHRPQAFAIL